MEMMMETVFVEVLAIEFDHKSPWHTRTVTLVLVDTQSPSPLPSIRGRAALGFAPTVPANPHVSAPRAP
jgi:hypothetical protein